MKNPLIILILGILTTMSCEAPRTPKDLAAEALIPRPKSVTATGSSFLLQNGAIIALNGNEALGKAAEFLSKEITLLTGLETAVDNLAEKGSISLKVNSAISTNDEGYSLEVTEDNITLTGRTEAGVFRGIQTLIQLLPLNKESVEIASGIIEDEPRFEYRGAMLDVARHFFSVQDVKQFIDYLAYYKMNYLHLGLTNDQGWRIEIKSWPKLAQIGGSTEVGGGEGGYYTQEEYKDIVRYAAERHVTIVPEIDMPGHCHAALASYKELNCQPYAVDLSREMNPDGLYTGIEVGFSSFCTDSDLTYKFVTDVLTELAEMTPGPYLHIGGDETHATKDDDYKYFMNRVLDSVATLGKVVVGWDELAQADVNNQTVLQLWNSMEFGEMAVNKGSKLIMSPADRTYMDMQYDSTTQWGLHWAAYIEVNDGYQWDPAKLSENIDDEDILGIEAPLWSETIDNMDEIEYMTFPRLLGYAEIGWTTSQRDWDEYRIRLGQFSDRFEKREINYYQSATVDWR